MFWKGSAKGASKQFDGVYDDRLGGRLVLTKCTVLLFLKPMACKLYDGMGQTAQDKAQLFLPASSVYKRQHELGAR